MASSCLFPASFLHLRPMAGPERLNAGIATMRISSSRGHTSPHTAVAPTGACSVLTRTSTLSALPARYPSSWTRFGRVVQMKLPLRPVLPPQLFHAFEGTESRFAAVSHTVTHSDASFVMTSCERVLARKGDACQEPKCHGEMSVASNVLLIRA